MPPPRVPVAGAPPPRGMMQPPPVRVLPPPGHPGAAQGPPRMNAPPPGQPLVRGPPPSMFWPKYTAAVRTAAVYMTSPLLIYMYTLEEESISRRKF